MPSSLLFFRSSGLDPSRLHPSFRLHLWSGLISRFSKSSHPDLFAFMLIPTSRSIHYRVVPISVSNMLRAWNVVASSQYPSEIQPLSCALPCQVAQSSEAGLFFFFLFHPQYIPQMVSPSGTGQLRSHEASVAKGRRHSAPRSASSSRMAFMTPLHRILSTSPRSSHMPSASSSSTFLSASVATRGLT